MHEWALAESVIEATAAVLGGRDPLRLRSVVVVIGELQAIDREIFDFALRTMVEDRPFRAAVFEVRTEPAAFLCTACGHAWAMAETRGLDAESRESIHFLPEAGHAFIRCPSCAGPDYTVTSGRGVYIESIGVEETGGAR
jgi:hydrogenase nickel incorporation protein HypA/HybF